MLRHLRPGPTIRKNIMMRFMSTGHGEHVRMREEAYAMTMRGKNMPMCTVYVPMYVPEKAFKLGGFLKSKGTKAKKALQRIWRKVTGKH